MAREIIRPCAACKHQHRRCDISCDLAPYFPADKPQRYNLVHAVFGRRNVSKMLQEIDISHREQAADALVYEAEARLRDPVHGCVGPASILENRLKEVQENLKNVKNELAKYLPPEIIQFVLSNPDLFGLAPNNNQDPQGNHVSEQPSTELTATQQHNLELLKQMVRRHVTGFNPVGGGGEGHHFGFHVPVCAPISAVMAPSFDNGGTSTSVYHTQLQSSQEPPHQQE